MVVVGKRDHTLAVQMLYRTLRETVLQTTCFVSAIHALSEKGAHKQMNIKEIPVRDTLRLHCPILPLALHRQVL